MKHILPKHHSKRVHRVYGLKSKTWVSINLLCLVLLPALVFGMKAQAAENLIASADYVSPLSDNAYIVQPPISPTPSYLSAQQAYIYTKHHPDIEYRIYGLESSYGLHDGCRDKGEFNGFGYRQNKSEWVCYPTFQEAADNVDQWLVEKLDNEHLKLGEALCLYNQGSENSLCRYASNFLNL